MQKKKKNIEKRGRAIRFFFLRILSLVIAADVGEIVLHRFYSLYFSLFILYLKVKRNELARQIFFLS